MALLRSLVRRTAASESAAPIKMIVGLGNPGPEYARHRHNIGFQVVDAFAERHRLSFDKFQRRARMTLADLALDNRWSGRVLLAKPMTFMNASGEAVAPLAAFYKILPADILVVFDDLDLPQGRIRLRADGGAGGHRGMKSIIQHLHTEAFPRLRVGIGRPPGQMDPADYVLQNFSPAEEQEMALARVRAVEAIEVWLAQGIEAAMNLFNAGPGQGA